MIKIVFSVAISRFLDGHATLLSPPPLAAVRTLTVSRLLLHAGSFQRRETKDRNRMYSQATPPLNMALSLSNKFCLVMMAYY